MFKLTSYAANNLIWHGKQKVNFSVKPEATLLNIDNICDLLKYF